MAPGDKFSSTGKLTCPPSERNREEGTTTPAGYCSALSSAR